MGDMFPIMGSPRNWLDASSLPESLNLSEFVGGRSERTRDSVGLAHLSGLPVLRTVMDGALTAPFARQLGAMTPGRTLAGSVPVWSWPQA